MTQRTQAEIIWAMHEWLLHLVNDQHRNLVQALHDAAQLGVSEWRAQAEFFFDKPVLKATLIHAMGAALAAGMPRQWPSQQSRSSREPDLHAGPPRG